VACLADEVWIATNGGTFVRYSEDAGGTWRDVAVPTDVAVLGGISAPARGVAIAVGLDATNHPLIIRTADGGATWGRQPIDGSTGEGFLNDVSFASSAAGTAVGQLNSPSSLTAISENQGITWTSGDSLAGDVQLRDVARIEE
jgi:photosystem II stability/assembly factor-like uncharacterized protein